MPIQVVCSNCQKRYTVKDELAGKKIRCKACETVMSVPAAAPVAVPPPLPPLPTPVPPSPPQHWASRDASDLGPPPGITNNMGFKSWRQGIWSGIVIVVVLALLAGKFYLKMNRQSSSSSTPAASWTPTPTTVTVPPRPQMQDKDGYRVGTVTLTNRVGLPTTVKVFLPPGNHQPRSLSCVMVAPAGSGVIFGMGLGESDEAEQIPYARAGFAVVAYSLSGEPAGGLQNATWGTLQTAAEQFHGAGGGVVDAGDALTYALQRFPEINPNRVGCAGHSSAGLHTLLLSRKESRIKACSSYAPSIDPRAHVNKYFNELKQLVPDLEAWAGNYAPAAPRVPTMLFIAADDEAISVPAVKAYADTHPRLITYKQASSGGHYESMIQLGIPEGIKFFRRELK